MMSAKAMNLSAALLKAPALTLPLTQDIFLDILKNIDAERQLLNLTILSPAWHQTSHEEDYSTSLLPSE